MELREGFQLGRDAAAAVVAAAAAANRKTTGTLLSRKPRLQKQTPGSRGADTPEASSPGADAPQLGSQGVDAP